MKAFARKEKELDSFVRPAQEKPGSEFRNCFRKLTHEYLQSTLAALVNHYQARKDELCIEIQHMNVSKTVFQTSIQIALKWGRKNFRSKLKMGTLDQFHCEMEKLCSGPSSNQDSAKTTQSNENPPKPVAVPKSKITPTSSPALPVSGPHVPPSAPVPLTSPAQERVGDREVVVVEELEIREMQTEEEGKKEASFSYSVPLSTSAPLYDPTVPSQNVQGAHDCLSNFFPCTFSFNGNRYHSTEHAYQTEQALFLKRYNIARDIRQARTASDAKRASKPLKTDPNSNEWDKRKKAIMRNILQAKAQQVSLFRESLIKSHPKRLTHVIPGTRDSFWATKYSSIRCGKMFMGQDVFATLLMDIRNSLTPSANASVQTPPKAKPQSNTMPSNRFSVLQNLNSEEDFPSLPSPTGTPITNTPSPTASDKRASNSKSNTTPVSSRPKPKPATQGPKPKAALPKKKYHKGGSTHVKGSWPSPTCTADLVILGDSNVNRITEVELPLDTVDSVEYHSYGGAKFVNFGTRGLLQNKPQIEPTKVILSVGINSKDNSPSTNTDQIKKAINQAKNYFPNAQIYIPQVNYPANFSDREQNTLNHVNTYLTEMAGRLNSFSTIPKLADSVFITEVKDPIHWTPTTANAILNHWLGHLN
jgi:ribA/ribD-fused uncharacterized protein